MAKRAEQLKEELVEKVVALVRERVAADRATETERFVRAFYSTVPAIDLADETADNLYGAALSIWNFARKRAVVGQPQVRVYNPQQEEHGWKSSHTVVEIINDDMPFLVDSVTAELARHEADVALVIHPILQVSRDAKGCLTAFQLPGKSAGNGANESIMHVQVAEQPAENHKVIEERLLSVLADVRASVVDWKEMRQRLRDRVAELKKMPPDLPKKELDEALAFLSWLDDDHFTYLGYREYSFEGQGKKAVARIDEKSCLGVLRDTEYSVFDGLRNLGDLPPDVQDFVRRPTLLRITKANRRSTVHRAVHMDTVVIKSFDAKGKVKGEKLFLGLFTSAAYSRNPREIPVLRQKVENVIAKAGFASGSHDAKALQHILDSYPRDELFQISETRLLEIALGILHLQERRRTALFVRHDPFERFVSCLVFTPRDRFDTNLRVKFQEILADAYNGVVNATYTQLSDEALARVHIVVRTQQGKVPAVDHDLLEQHLAEASRAWTDLLEEALVEEMGEERGLTTARRYQRAFPANYSETNLARTAVFDIARVGDTLKSGKLSMNLYRPLEKAEDHIHFKIYHGAEPVPLSDVLPMLENMGLKVISEVPFEVRPQQADKSVWIHDFHARTRDGHAIDLTRVKAAFHETFARVWAGEMEDDGFNQLVIRAGLGARQVIILRAYCKFLRQAAIPFSQDYMEETLSANPELSRLLVELFEVRFDPALGNERAKLQKELVARIEEGLEGVSNLDQDRIIRRFLNAILSTLRTNFHQQTSDGGEKPCLSLKFASRDLEELPQPKPFREIFVYGPRVEGVHLRFGKVARGGLRWSDRREDFRTEVLGLVKAQQVKNAVIVPVGSKGGFVLKKSPPPEAGREALLEEGIACYRLFIRSLLDVTDNLVKGEIVPPPYVVRHDEDDPYLVVAADKGTATFSDIANGVSAEYGFWLDDAFASGGSAGYDHKKMAITARGAWESVKRHFRELGKNIQKEPFTVVGCGDMSGDVFGNGMLLSPCIRLQAAFNHLHIFVDPNPDPTSSHKERQRLFDLPRSAWSDYDAKLISKGGGVFERKAKSIKLTPEIKKLFGIKVDQVTPNEFIQAILRSEAELLWFGGIGTYVKSSEESHLEVGDRANDALRVDARELRCKVVGEGANLGMTQRARTECGLLGVRLNTDAIDNSAGVDCSDHEVNIKILLGDAEQAGDLTRKQRDKLLVQMTDEVADLVLRDNYLQTQAISVTHGMSAHLLDRIARYMRSLEKQGLLSRAIEYLPDDEVIDERMKKRQGLSRAELAVLLSYSKIALYDELLGSDLPDDPDLMEDLVNYFPTPLRKKYGPQIENHRLRREIAATVVTNSIINRAGISFVHEVAEKTGLPSDDIARAYTVAREIFELRDRWSDIEGLDNKVPTKAQYTMIAECGRLVERGTVWLLRHVAQPMHISQTVKRYRDGTRALAACLKTVLPQEDVKVLTTAAGRLTAEGVPEELAERIAAFPWLVPAGDIVDTAHAAGLSVEDAARTYFAVGQRFGFDWLRRAAAKLPSDNAWDKLAVTAIVDDLYELQSEMENRILDGIKAKQNPMQMLDAWTEERRMLVSRAEQMIGELRAAGQPDLAMLAVANRRLKSLVAR
ncbi:NAD-glutamate dehydrogenase [Limibacillus halophilus]|uniref:Glutamate dehydrogenase n=1 Tax=Limibacillus halophilus TaxID=1579333 RepID=A0A839SPF7_9PROT|nr:NAD-glutamate dehydrogenase domain-containing protein [Limibacillus halophilus]MBB3063809.1 glutamate dehydrogenase [Limibacillus halophilus]